MSKYATLSAFKAYKKVAGTTEDAILQSTLDWAEMTFERLAGSAFDAQTVTNETPAAWFVDRFGTLHLTALERGPVTAVSAVSYRSAGPGYAWQALAWDPANDLRLPPGQAAPPHPRAWSVSISPSNVRLVPGAETLLVRWTYTGGYALAPAGLETLIERLAAWKYELRQAPLGRISSDMFGTREVIQALPKDVAADILLWQKTVLG